MEKRSSKYIFKLGVFVLVGLSIFIGGIFYIGKQKHLFNPVFTVNADFRDISGLMVGNNVRFSGINVGTVNFITIINDSTVRVNMVVDKEVQRFIKTDSHAKINSEGVIGDKIIVITQGSNHYPSVRNGAFLASVEPVEVDAIIANLAVTSENAQEISSELATMLHRINYGNGTLSRLIRDSLIADNIDKTIINLRKSSKGLDENMEAAKHNFFLRGYFKDKNKKKKTKVPEVNSKDKAKTETNGKKDRKIFKRLRARDEKENEK